MSAYVNSETVNSLCMTSNYTTITFDGKNYACNKSQLLLTSPMTNDSRIDSETYTITKICYTLALFSTLLHILIILCFRRIRNLYGVCIMTCCLFYTASYLMSLITCSLPKSYFTHYIFGYLADYCILTTMTMNLKSSVGITYSLWDAKKGKSCCTDYLFCNRFNVSLSCTKQCNYVVGYITVIGLPLCEIILNVTLFKSDNYITVEHEEFADISCNLIPNYGHFYLFFPLLFTLLLIQFVCIIYVTKLRAYKHHKAEGDASSTAVPGGDDDDDDNFSLLWSTTNISARFWITTKFTITHALVWIIAFLALIQASIALWHVFTLLNSLQAIYITVNCTFTRPVLDLIYQWREEKLDYYKQEHNLYTTNHILSTHNQNEKTKSRK